MRRSCSCARTIPTSSRDVPERVALTVAGHLHGGQVNVPILRHAVLPSRYGDRYLAGHVVEHGRHLYVSSRPRHRRAAAPAAPPARAPRADPQSPRAQDSSRVTCSSSRPVAGSVRTSSVGPGRSRRPRLAGGVEARRRSTRRGVRAGSRLDRRRASSGARDAPGGAANVRCGQPPGRPSRRGSCSSARSSQPVHQAQLERRGEPHQPRARRPREHVRECRPRSSTRRRQGAAAEAEQGQHAVDVDQQQGARSGSHLRSRR